MDGPDAERDGQRVAAWARRLAEAVGLPERRVLDTPELRRALGVVQCHHERYDGAGYPRRLKARAIPLEARVFSVVDAFDAMVSGRPYRAPISPEAAREEIRKGSGTQFDPNVVRAFLAIDVRAWRTLGALAA